MDKKIKSFFNSLFFPACIIDRELKILYANTDFLNLCEIPEQDIQERIHLDSCLNTRLFTGNKSVKKRRITAVTSKGTHLSLHISIIPANIISDKSEYRILIFSVIQDKKSIDKYKGLYEKEENERKKLEEYNRRLNELIDTKAKELENARRDLKKAYFTIKTDEEIAKSIHSCLISKTIPDLMNINVASVYVPTSKIGGDMFDVITIGDNKTALLIFDVSGFGVPSALICATAKTLFLYYLKSLDRPSEIFTAINKDLCSLIKSERYLTAFLGIIDHSDNTMVYSQAGHVYPVIYHDKTGKASFIPGNSVFIGHTALSDVAIYHDIWVSLTWGDKILFYTDGLIESQNEDNDMFGSRRLADAVAKYGKHNLDTMINYILLDNEKYRNGTPHRDDVSLMAIQIGCSGEILDRSGFSKEDQPQMSILHSHDEIENICSIILNKLDKKGYTDKEIFQSHQSIHEILSNALRHGNKFNVDKKVFVLYKITLDNFFISVIDEGDGFNYNTISHPSIKRDSIKSPGKGLFLVKKFMDEVRFNEQGNRIMVGKHRKQEK